MGFRVKDFVLTFIKRACNDGRNKSLVTDECTPSTTVSIVTKKLLKLYLIFDGTTNGLSCISNLHNIAVIVMCCTRAYVATGYNSYLLQTHRKCKGPPTVHYSAFIN